MAVAAPAAVAAAQQPLTPTQLEQLREAARARQEAEGDEAQAQVETVRLRNAGSAAVGALLDRPISRAAYRLGPGDVLTLSIFGYRNQVFPLTVTPEGSIVIPTVGVIQVGGSNLNEAEQRARHQVLRFYPGADVDLSLTAVRSFKVFLLGDVMDPGVRPATAVTRVSELVPIANEDLVIHRNVRVNRAADTLNVDLARFLRMGDLAHNPVLEQGDVIRVPRVDETVTISGEVAYPGRYEFRGGETLAELLRIANGGGAFLSGAADTLLLMRFTRYPRGEVQSIGRSDAIGFIGSQIVMEPFDAIFLPRVSHFKRRTTATIEGELMRPGEYPIQPNITTVWDLVSMAGGFTEDASLVEAVLRREPMGVPNDTVSPRALETLPPNLLTRAEQRILQITSRGAEESDVIDLSHGAPAYSLTLEDGDLLYIPSGREHVVVMGGVGRPGIVPFVPEQPIEAYVQMAGGYTRRADVGNVVIQRAKLGISLHRRDIRAVEPGDRIVIPLKPRTTFLERVQTTQGIVNTISGLVLTIVGLERLWDAIAN